MKTEEEIKKRLSELESPNIGSNKMPKTYVIEIVGQVLALKWVLE